MLQAVLLFAVGLLCLIEGGDWFVDGATGLARRFYLPELLIGATVVSIGTTLPEIMVSTTSALTGHGEITYGNAIGSVICNTALIAALTIAVRPAAVDKQAFTTPVAFFFAAAGLYAGVAYISGYFSRGIGLALLGLFAVYMVITVLQMTGKSQASARAAGETPLMKNLLLLVVGAALSPFAIPQNSTIFGINASLVLDIPVMFAVMLLLTIPALAKEKLYRVQGFVLLLLYAAFCAAQFFMGAV